MLSEAMSAAKKERGCWSTSQCYTMFIHFDVDFNAEEEVLQFITDSVCILPTTVAVEYSLQAVAASLHCAMQDSSTWGSTAQYSPALHSTELDHAPWRYFCHKQDQCTPTCVLQPNLCILEEAGAHS